MLIDIFSLKFPKNVKGILHLGAHDCEERVKYLSRFDNITDNDIIWIDALIDKVNSIKQKNSSIQIYNECISNSDAQTVTFNVTNNYQSSSFLKLKEHLIEHPDIHQISSIEMKTKTLKTFYDENNFKYDQFNFFAIDIQGAELLALIGAGYILEHVDYIYIEVNTKELYENCPLLNDIDSYLLKFNFVRQNILMTEHGWGDAFYVKKQFNISNGIKIYYGTDLNRIDITETVLIKNKNKNIIHIPAGDQSRANFYGDPVFGQLKNIYIESNNDSYIIDHNDNIYLNIDDNMIGINYSPKKYNYELSILAIFKNETMNLKIWLDHYLWQGVEHFYLIDNDSNDKPLDILQEYIDKGVVTYYFKPEKYQQVEHYRNVFDIERLKEKTRWLCICDLDEFFFGTEKKLVSAIYEFDGYDVIYTNSFFYGNDNLIHQPIDIRTSIVHRTNDMINGNKYIFKPKCITDSSEIWIHWLVHSGSIQKKILSTETFNNTKIRLNHYIVQSLEYWQNIKMKRGDVNNIQSENVRNMDIFYSYGKEAIIKDDTLKQIIENDLYYKNGEVMKFYDEHNNLIDNNSLEKPEQDLVNQYILEDDIVLELGARYGTVSCTINKKLNNRKNQVSVEPDDRVWNALDINKIKNACDFNIIKGFISNKKLDLTNLAEGLAAYGATFIESNDTKIPSYSLDEIKTKYGINKFTALVADCEGFLEVFFDENPDLYNNLRFVMFEADYADKCNYDKIKQNLILHNFVKIIEGHQNIWIKSDDNIDNHNNNLYETVFIQYFNDGIKTEPNYLVSNTQHKIHKFENVYSYEYKFCMSEIKIIKNNISFKKNPTYYFISDDFGYTGFGHWVFESLIFFNILEDLNKIYPNIKILTSNKKKYVKNFYYFVGIKNEIVYEISDYNNICFIPPINSLTRGINFNVFDYYNNQFIDKIRKNTINFNFTNNIIFLPRNSKENYFPDDKIPIHLLRERRDQNEIDFISEGVIKNGGIVLNTYEINNFFIQFSMVMNSKNIIVEYGSAFHVNCIACKNKNIIVLDSNKTNCHIVIPSIIYLHDIIETNNKVTILCEYNNFEDINKFII
jgi:FkbM family methyltransferase